MTLEKLSVVHFSRHQHTYALTHMNTHTHAQTHSLSLSSAKFSLDGVLSDLLSIFFSPSQPFVCLQVDATNFPGASHLLK